MEVDRLSLIKRLHENRSTILPVAALIILLIFLRAFNPQFLATHDSIVTLVYSISWFLIAACGLTMVILMGSFDFSVPSIVRLAALGTAVFYPQFGWKGIILIFIVCLILGVLNGILLTKFNVPSFMATLGTAVVAEGLAKLFSGGFLQVVRDPAFLAISRTFIPPGIGLPSIFYWAIVLWAIALILTFATPFGRKIYAIGLNLEGSKLAGINVTLIRIIVFTLSAAYAAVAGILYMAQLGGGAIELGEMQTIPLLASVVVGGTALTGGIGGVHRTLLGVLVVNWLDTGMSMLAIDYNMRMVIFGIVAIIMAAATIDRRKIRFIK